MAQKQVQKGQGGIAKIMPKWLNAKRIILLFILLMILPGIGIVIDILLLLWWRAKSQNKQQ
jgi:ABC-type Fe3+ transport system permease subunit